MAAQTRVPYVDYHPGPGDATAHYAEEAMRRAANSPEAAHGDRVTATVSSIESPSVQIAWRLRMAEIGIELPFAPFYETVQQPDPRVPKGQVEFSLWAYQGTHAHPSIGAPDPRAGEAVGRLAGTRYHLPAWSEAAHAVAGRLGPGWMQQLLATMVHPPPAPEHVHPLEWVPRVQLAAALIVSWFDTGFTTLRTVALGPVDWVVDAAVVALGDLAIRTPALCREVVSLFEFLRRQVPAEGFTCFAYPLVNTWMRLVPASDPRHAELQQWRTQILANDVGVTTSSGVIGLIDGLNLEDYAEFCVRQEMVQAGHGGTVAALAAEYGLPLLGPAHTYSEDWAEAIDADPRLQLAFEQTKGRFRLSVQGIDPDSDEARFSHNIMQGKGLDHAEEMRKAQAAQARLGGDGDPDPVVFPGQPVARLSDYVGMMKRMQSGDFNGTLAASGLSMVAYGQVTQAWGAKLGTDPALNAKMAAMLGT